MQQIQLTKGLVTLVDDDDYDYLNQFLWTVNTTSHPYVVRSAKKRERNGKSAYKIYMHHVVLKSDRSYVVDHIDRNLLNNQKYNLRLVTMSQNIATAYFRPKGTSQYRGVSWDKRRSVWECKIKVHKKSIFLGYFDDEAKAAMRYNQAALTYFGEFAALNEVQQVKLGLI